MKRTRRQAAALALALGLAAAAAAPAQEVSFKDPRDDDNGPGKYTYPTDPIYRPGSFDLTGFRLKARGDRVEVEVTLAAKLADPWKTGSGFSLQTIFVFVQTTARTEKKAGAAAGAAPVAATARTPASATQAGAAAAPKSEAASKSEAVPKPETAPAPGFTQAPPGLNVQFGPNDAWDRCIILSPEAPSRVREEVAAKVPAAMQPAIVIPAQVRGSGRTIAASFGRGLLGRGDPRAWGFQVLVAGYDPFPAQTDLLVRRVNETESQHRFGGGSDGDCDPNVLDILAGNGEDEAAEVEAQHKMMQYECNPDGSAKKLATLVMVRVKKEAELSDADSKDKKGKKEKKGDGKKEQQQPPPAPPPPTTGASPESHGARLPAAAGSR